MQLYGGIEAGGTKFVCAVAEQPDSDFIEKTSFPTTTPQETLKRSIEFFKQYQLKALGVGSFGPVDLDVASPTYGYIMATPKAGWVNTDLLGPLRSALHVPIGFDTDVNGAALAEYATSKSAASESLVYFTVGTGIGGGVVIGGQPVHGWTHPEVGHIPVKRHPEDNFAGSCPYHGDCLEGMASGPALQARWGAPADSFPADHLAWEFEAYYLAQAVSTVAYVVSPHRVILGGGVMHQAQLLPAIRQNLLQLLNRYLTNPATPEAMETFVTSPHLGDDAGIRGALELGARALKTISIQKA